LSEVQFWRLFVHRHFFFYFAQFPGVGKHPKNETSLIPYLLTLVGRWVEENRAAIKSYNEFVEEHGCFGDEFREF